MMKIIFLGVATVSAFAFAAPAVAQYGSNYGADSNINVRIGQLQTRIQTGVQQGSITQQEAVQLRQQLRQLRQLERQYSANGLTGQERGDLQRRMQNLRQQIRFAEGRQGGNGYGQYGNGDQYGQDSRVDRDRDGYYDRDYNRNGRWNDDQGGEDDQYDDRDRADRYQQPAQRGGIGGMIDSMLGTGGLRVGQRASSNLYGVPPEYRGQYRDGDGAYYRSDGRNIYQIDARSQTVVRVYPMSR
jgi:hypothetical protein